MRVGPFRKARAARGVAAGLLLAAACSRTGLGAPDAAPRLALADGAIDAAPVDGAVDAGAPVEPVCIPVPPDGGPVQAALTLPVSLAVVDLVFLLDASGSMDDEIENIRTRLRTRVVPGVRAAIPDAAFGVALLGEFPVSPYGPPEVEPYRLRTPITRDLSQVESALSNTPSWGNYDEPEAQVEAMYQVATGEGLAPFIPPSLGCPSGGSGGVCFRPEALPVILLITDAPFHDGPPGVSPVAPYDLDPAPHGYAEAVAALRGRGALVIGLGASDAGSLSPMEHLRAIARDTGAVTPDGPLAFDIGRAGTGFGQGVVDAVEALASGVPLDVSATVVDVPGDAFDVTERVTAVRPLEADPMRGVRRIGPDGFEGVLPGTRVTFEVEVTAEGLDPADLPVSIPGQVVFRAFDRGRIGLVPIVVAIGGAGCP